MPLYQIGIVDIFKKHSRSDKGHSHLSKLSAKGGMRYHANHSTRKPDQVLEHNVFYHQFEKKTPQFDLTGAMNGGANHHVIEKSE